MSKITRSGELLNPEGKLVKFNSITELANKYNLSKFHITPVLDGERKTYKGWEKQPEKPYKIKDPEGNIHSFVHFGVFCKKHSLNPSILISVINNKLSHCNRWVLPENPNIPLSKPREYPIYELISPDGELFKVCNIMKFCKDNNLERTGINKLLRGQLIKINGWTKKV